MKTKQLVKECMSHVRITCIGSISDDVNKKNRIKFYKKIMSRLSGITQSLCEYLNTV